MKPEVHWERHFYIKECKDQLEKPMDSESGVSSFKIMSMLSPLLPQIDMTESTCVGHCVRPWTMANNSMC